MGVRRRYPPYALRFLGALALLGVGAVHIDQYFAVHYRVVPVIGTLFLLNLIGAAAIALLLIVPVERLLDDAGPAVVGLLAVAGIGLAVTSGVFLLISEHTTLFGFTFFVVWAAWRNSLARNLVLLALFVLVTLVGPSRVYLGHHWLSDVLASYSLGTGFLAALVGLHRRHLDDGAA